MKKILLALLAFSFTVLVNAQDKLLSMEDAMLKARTTLAAENLKQIQLLNGSSEYVYLKKVNDQDIWVKGNEKTETNFLTLTQFNSWLKQGGLDTANSMPAIQFAATGWITNVNGNKISIDPLSKKTTVLLPKALADKTNAEESAAGFVAYLDRDNLYVAAVSAPDQPVLITRDGSKNIVYASSVHRDEFGINKGIFWSKSGKKLAFYRMDQSMVTDYPIIDWSVRPAKAETIKYPMAGDPSHHVTVGVYDAISQKTIWLKTGEPAEQYLTNIAWSPDDKYVYIAVLNRGQNHMWLNQYDANTGDFVKTLFEETDDKYTEPLVPMLFVKNKPGQFIWQSNRDGWNHLYLYDTSGKLIRQLTKGNWEVLEVKGFDNNGINLYYVSTAVSPVDRNLYSLNMASGSSRCLTPARGVHNAQADIYGAYNILDAYTTPSNPRTILFTHIDLKGTPHTKVLLQAADPLKDYSKGDLSIFTIPNNAGDSLYCRLFKPAHFDASKKYPVIVYWYGGPHAQLILNGWNGGAGDYWFQYMAERGYVVFTLDTRGSDNRGKVFEQSMFRKLGDVQMDDLMAGVDYLKKQTYTDPSNMALFGWSFGGFMTTNFVLNHPGVFKAAVAGGPVMDWRYYEIMYTERYMDTPQENPEGYKATDLTAQAGKLKDHLLLIHGLQDPVVVQQHSVRFVRAAIDKNVQVDYMIYPGHEHNVLGKDRAHLYEKVTEYIMEKLGTPKAF